MAYPLPRWIAHRGGGALAPENTLAGIRLAARLGFRAVEFDVMLTADGVPVVIHDETLRRTTDRRGRVAERSSAEIAGADAGVRFHAAWAGEGLPRCEQALDLCAALGLAANVEIKPAAGHERATGVAVAALAAVRWPAGRPILLSSFSDTALAAAREAAPDLPRALLVGDIPANWRQRLRTVDALALHARAESLSPAGVGELLAAGVPVAAYTVNTAELADACLAMGVAALFTDRLDIFGPD